MAGNITHMLICKAAIERAANENHIHNNYIAEIFNNNLTNKKTLLWAYLGSMAPDLFYYRAPAKALWQFYVDKYLKSEMMEPWSYHMHSVRPNVMPLKLIEITFRDAIINAKNYVLEDIDFNKLAFIIGYLSHIATDQVTHRTANIMVGPYYRKGPNRKLHREWEIQMDYHLYESLNCNNQNYIPFEKQDFSSWAFYIDRSVKSMAKTFSNYVIKHFISFILNFCFRPIQVLSFCIRLAAQHTSEEWFTPFFQRAFAETYGSFPSESEINYSYITLGILLFTTKKAKPYKKAKDKYINGYKDNQKYKDYFLGNLFFDDYERSVKKSTKYIGAFLEAYSILFKNRILSPNDVDKFLNIIESNDLSCPFY